MISIKKWWSNHNNELIVWIIVIIFMFAGIVHLATT